MEHREWDNDIMCLVLVLYLVLVLVLVFVLCLLLNAHGCTQGVCVLSSCLLMCISMYV